MNRIIPILAGYYWSDCGAFMGVLPYPLWHKKTFVDQRQRRKLNLNLLLIQSGKRNILIDTGLGNHLTDKQKDIYQPSEFLLPYSLAKWELKDTDITDVIMTHLHFDHAGGIITDFGPNNALTFPNAHYWIQKSEWEMAKNPDELNHSAYQFEQQLALLEKRGNITLLEGNAEIEKGILLFLVGGHTVGSQTVAIDFGTTYYLYAGDIIPTLFHTSMAVTSAYDVNRMQTAAAKKMIYSQLQEHNGTLILCHDTEKWQIPYSELGHKKANENRNE